MKRRDKRKIRHHRLRKKIKGTEERPRLCVFRSNKHIYAQIIDDKRGKVLTSASDLEIDKKKREKKEKKELAAEVGKIIAEKAKKEKIKKVVFDRGGYAYHGRVKALAENARDGGLDF